MQGEDYQAESSTRPLRRRAARMARPARVRIRARKPCTLARRRLFGWNVRLLIMISVTPSLTPEQRGSRPDVPERKVNLSIVGRVAWNVKEGGIIHTLHTRVLTTRRSGLEWRG